MYAGRKRRKAVQKAVKPPPAEGVKSNPSKRHRDRLNSELERLARLLPFPEDVTSSLDKLSILRLSVSFLRTQNFFSIALKNHTSKKLQPSHSNHDNVKATGLVSERLPEGELLLQALNGFVLAVTSEGIIFYASHTIQDYLGFHQTDVLHQCVFELIHTEDQQMFRRNLHWALNPPAAEQEDNQDTNSLNKDPVPSSSLVIYKPDQLPAENSSFLERSFICRFRCLLDNCSGFLALNLQGRLKILHGQNRRLDNGGQAPPQLALFAIATPLQLPSILEVRTKNMIFRTKHQLDFTPMACDAKGKIVLGYTEAELRVRGTGYQFIHAADMLYCAENHVRMIKTGESGLTVFRLLTKDNRWKWVQANARLVYKNGKPDYIIATQRPLGEEEGGEHLSKRSMHLPFTFATGEALLYQTSFPVPGFSENMVAKGKSVKAKKAKGCKGSKDALDPSSLLGAMMQQDESVYVCQPAVEHKFPYHNSILSIQEDTGACSSTAQSESWNPAPNGVKGVSKMEASTSYDPLLATLDSLSLENEVSCSNSELFNALENLGMDAEELEMLLLDERMIRVEMEPEYIPSLNDLLTNNEIISYIHNSLENQTNNHVSLTVPDLLDPIQSSPVALTLPPVSDLTSTSISSQFFPLYPLKHPSPMLQLSQQMQQHLSTQSLHQMNHNWSPAQQISDSGMVSVSTQSSGLVNAVTAVQNGHWNPGPTQVDVKLLEPNKDQQHSLQKQIQSECPLQNRHFSISQWQGYNNTDQVDQLINTGCHVDYNMATGSGMDLSYTNISGQFQSGLMPTASYQQVDQKQQPKVPPTDYSYANQNTSVEHNFSSLNACEIFDPAQPHDSTYSKMENSFVQNPTNTAHSGSCPLPTNSVTTAVINKPHPPLPGPSTTGFYLQQNPHDEPIPMSPSWLRQCPRERTLR